MNAKSSPAALARPVVLLALAALPPLAQASFLPPEAVDTVATYIAWFVLIVMPIIGITIFWLVHILPEKVAEKRHHPQKDAIQTLCLLSLLFGGLLWPIAWLWAYTKPTAYRLAYGTDKHDDYFVHAAERASAGQLGADERQHLRDELDATAARGALTPAMHDALARLAAAESAARPADNQVPTAPVAPRGAA